MARIILFGSRARGDHRERSDVDLAIACPDAGRPGWLALAALADAAPTLLGIDLVRLETADPALAGQIAREGIVLHERG